MDFTLSDEQNMLLDSFRRFLESELRPVADRTRDTYIEKPEALAIQKQLIPFGVVNGMVPESMGGMDLDLVTYGMLMHELARVSPDIAITTQIFGLSAKMMKITPPHLKEQYLGPLMACEKVASIALSEPDVGSDLSAVKLRARLDGDQYVLNGEKTWISSGGYSDFIYCLARFQGGEQEGLGVILVDRSHGYETANLNKTALNSQSTAQVFFQDVRVPASNMVVQPPKALPALFELLSMSRPIVGLMALGVARAALDEAITYAKERVQFGAPIASKQMVQEKIAVMATKLEAGLLLCYRALEKSERGERPDPEAAMAKWYATEMAIEIVHDAVQIHGGNGITRDYLVEYLFRAVRVYAFTEGTTEIQKLMIGRTLLGVPAF
ncbi:MAG: acyl-CoA/acyl-ACP dehydrogenase [Henriciella sp.]|nr:acyl-CoA/acyl-ACP dehydrogenase [Henriciella sp.]